MDSSGLLLVLYGRQAIAIGIRRMDEGVMKLDILKDSKGHQVGATNREQRPGTPKSIGDCEDA
jgi:hypothetical protein